MLHTQHSTHRRTTTLALWVVALLCVVALIFPAAGSAAGTTYYIDSGNGSDSNSGTSESSPWRSLSPLNSRNFAPGDVIRFRAGSTFSGGFVVNDSGAQGNPITFTSYGSGNKPTFRNPGSDTNHTRAIDIQADWVVVDGLKTDNSYHDGIRVGRGADHNIVRNCEVTNAGIGIPVYGQYNLITGNNVHDLHMVVDTPGGDDDFGAVGIWLFASDNEVSYNRMIRCKAPSQDYGSDGGTVEFYGDVNNCYVHHNWGEGNNSFTEIGGGSNHNNTLSYNVSVNNGMFAWFHLEGTFGTDTSNFRIENNTIIEDTERSENEYQLIGFRGSPGQDTMIFRNNVVYANDFWYVADASRNGWNYRHEYNLYYLPNGQSQLGFSLGTGEKVGDPRFANLGGRDLHLQAGSPAIDAGTKLSYGIDFENRSVPAGSAPDLGAFESSSAAPGPTPTPDPTPAPDPNVQVIDDSDAGFSVVSNQDDWQVYNDNGTQFYAGAHHYNESVGSGMDWATWSFNVPRPGVYAVSAWWCDGDWRPTDVPYRVQHRGGDTTMRQNQQANGGTWNHLGDFAFQDGGAVTISDAASSGSDIIADAIQVRYLGPLPAPSDPGANALFIPLARFDQS